jgi:MoxR-like ATPase
MTPTTYTKIFSPKEVETSTGEGSASTRVGDQREGTVYVYTEEIILAVNVALATGRPLLVRGPSGSGKSSLARNVANVLEFRYYETVVSSRTQARDLLWEVDLLRRLHDAQISDGNFSPDLKPYVVPGPLWWAFDRRTALEHGGPEAEPGRPQQHPDARAVVLLDEIDKADPDVPNNLLVPLGSLQFQVEETLEEVKTTAEQAPLLFITTNDERELPTAFLRRCVELTLPAAGRDRLVQIGRAHFKDMSEALLGRVADQTARVSAAGGGASDAMPSPAEYLDTLRACDRLKIGPDSPDWESVARMTLWKHGRSAPEADEEDEASE